MIACCLFDNNLLPELIMAYFQLDPAENNSITFYVELKIFSQDNAYENVVCKMTAILSRSYCVNVSFYIVVRDIKFFL